MIPCPSLASPEGRAELAAFYRGQLVDNVLPFWLRHGLDAEHDGMLTCLDRDGSLVDIDTRLLGEVATGQWLLVFTGAARELLDEQRAADILAAIAALEAALAGNYQPEQHFADLYHREPQLPPHLQALLTPDTPSS